MGRKFRSQKRLRTQCSGLGSLTTESCAPWLYDFPYKDSNSSASWHHMTFKTRVDQWHAHSLYQVQTMSPVPVPVPLFLLFQGDLYRPVIPHSPHKLFQTVCTLTTGLFLFVFKENSYSSLNVVILKYSFTSPSVRPLCGTDKRQKVVCLTACLSEMSANWYFSLLYRTWTRTCPSCWVERPADS